jgi:hypothetical protein
LPGLIEDLTLVTIEGGPHNIGWTYPDEVNKALLEFLAGDQQDARRDPALASASRPA